MKAEMAHVDFHGSGQIQSYWKVSGGRVVWWFFVSPLEFAHGRAKDFFGDKMVRKDVSKFLDNRVLL